LLGALRTKRGNGKPRLGQAEYRGDDQSRTVAGLLQIIYRKPFGAAEILRVGKFHEIIFNPD
jgi:hypothetical protein